MSNGKIIIEVENVVFKYNEYVTALKGVSCGIERGTTTAIIGQNGSGKTTLVKHFNGLLKPTEGRVLVDGKDTREYKMKELVSKVGYVFQNPTHQLFNTTIEEEIAFGLKNLGLPEDEIKRRVEETIKLFKLERFRGQHPLRLSFPYRKLLAIASVYAMQPEVLVLDEPTVAQDWVGYRLVRDLILSLKEMRKTVIIVTHDMMLVGEVADTCIVMSDGKILAHEKPEDLFTDEKVLNEAHLTPPQITQLATSLHGINKEIPRGVLTVKHMEHILESILNHRFNLSYS